MRALLLIAFCVTRSVHACECASEAVVRLTANPEIAQTALLGKAELSHSTKVFRVEASWTKYTGAVVLPESSKCDIHPALGKRFILLSIHSLDWFAEHKASPTICDSILLEPAKAGKVVARLAAKSDFGNHFGYNPSWGYCRRDKDCVISPGVCGGQDALHARYKVEHDKWRNRTAPVINCVAGPSGNDWVARCSDYFCAPYSQAELLLESR